MITTMGDLVPDDRTSATGTTARPLLADRPVRTDRATRRRAGRSTACSLCFGAMTHHDRQPYKLGPAHPKCVSQQAQAEAAQAQATLAQIQANAAVTMASIETSQRAQAMGLWLPGQQ